MKSKAVLIVDAVVNLILGIALLLFSPGIVRFFGVPAAVHSFYPNILGAVFIGVTIGLILELFRERTGMGGIGLGGAVAINLCGGAALAAWLAGGRLSIPVHGRVFLWVLFVFLVVISTIELIAHIRGNISKKSS